jgi:membrane-bound lytic murein transglycosylase MltF
MRTLSILLFFLLTVSASSSRADIYKYVDDNGVECYTDTPIDKKADKIYRDKSTTSTNVVRVKSEDTSDFHSIIHEKAETYDIDPSLIEAVIETESNWNSMAISRKGAMGLMQLMPSTASDMDVRNPFNPEENIEGGTKYLKYLLNRFKGDLTLALAAYNAGPNAVEKYGYIIPPYNETRQYVSKVLSLYNGSASDYYSAEQVNKSDKIYKVILEDGSVLFTNSSNLSRNRSRF